MAIADVGGADRVPRIAAIDVVRGVAIAAMVVYHAAFDLSAAGVIGVNVAEDIGWRVFARLIAGTFLALVGLNLALATHNGLRWRPYLRRLGLVIGAALLVTLGTWWFDPATFVFFGILHQIALASVLALPFLRLPLWLIVVTAAAAIAAPAIAASPIFNEPLLWWVGLSTVPPVSIDYVPLFPWFGVTLIGVVAGRLLVAYGGETAFARWRPTNRAERMVIRTGRWSLVIYLVHQPILVGALWLALPFLPQSQAMVGQSFMAECVPGCRAGGRDQPICTAICGCMFDNIYGTDLYTVPAIELMTPDQRQRWDDMLDVCLGVASVPPPPAARP